MTTGLEKNAAKRDLAQKAGQFKLGNDLAVTRLGFGAMRITGNGVWGEPADRPGALKVLLRAVELGVNFIDTADSYGPEVSEQLIAEALSPYPSDLVIATKGGFERPGPGAGSKTGCRGIYGRLAKGASGNCVSSGSTFTNCIGSILRSLPRTSSAR